MKYHYCPFFQFRKLIPVRFSPDQGHCARKEPDVTPGQQTWEPHYSVTIVYFIPEDQETVAIS